MRIIYAILGTFMLGLGIVGIVLPVLPTTPFIIAASWFYFRSSKKLSNWLHDHRFFGKYLNAFKRSPSQTRKLKIYSICLMWIMISISIYLLFNSIVWVVHLILLGLIGTISMLYFKN